VPQPMGARTVRAQEMLLRGSMLVYLVDKRSGVKFREFDYQA